MIHQYIADTLPMLSWLTVGQSVDRYSTNRKVPLGLYIVWLSTKGAGRYSVDSQQA